MVKSFQLLGLLVLSTLYLQKINASRESNNYHKENFQNDRRKSSKEEADFIIVGGGTAGCVLTARLSKKFSVLLLETGGKPPLDASIPRLSFLFSRAPVINFQYNPVPQEDAALENGGVPEVTGGKMLGGGSSHNDMIWTRGSAAGYDDWAEITGDESWQYKNLLKFMKRIENYHGSFPSSQHGTNGPVDIYEDNFSPGSELWQQAGKELGYETKDPNGPQTVGFGPTTYAKRHGRRVSSYTAYLKRALRHSDRRKRLRVSLHSTVLRVLIQDGRAIGVEYVKNGINHKAFAKKEVIVSAGAFVSPIILIRSGIGPVDQVRAAKVNQVKVLPVGQNLIDHPKMEIMFLINDSSINWYLKRNLTKQDVINFDIHGKGPLSASNQQMEAHVLSSKQKAEIIGYGTKNRNRSSKVKFIDPSLWPDLLISYTPFGHQPNSIYCTLGQYRPKSKGEIRFNATATNEDYWPIIDFRYYKSKDDLDVMIDGVNFCLDLMITKPFRKIGTRVEKNPYKSCDVHEFLSRDYWKCFIRHRTRSGCHSVGTCRMGSGKNDPLAVVDSKLRVIGVQRLRVVDASIMPEIINANTMAATYVIAEKAASDILQRYQLKKHRKS